MFRASLFVLIALLLLSFTGVGSFAQRPGRTTESSRTDLKLYPKLKEAVGRRGITAAEGVISSVVATETYCSFGVSSTTQGTSGFTVSDITDRKQELLLKTVLLAFEK